MGAERALSRPRVQVLDPSFNKYRLGLASVERIATGCRWSEGPVWFGDGRCLLWSDIPNNRIMRWDEETGRVSVFRKPSNNANGNTRDRQGRLVTCEHDTRRVTRTEYDGTITVLADKFDGKPLNSPNDVVVKSDGSIWFTDPPFGILGNYEGHVATPELPTNVYRLDPRPAQLDASRPATSTGRTGSPSRPTSRSSTSSRRRSTPRVIQVFDVVDDGTKLANKRAFITAEPGGTPDGFRVDVDGNLWCGWGMGNDAAGRREGVRPRRQADRPHRAARALRQRLLRRRQAQPPVHGGEPLGLFALREHAGREGRLIKLASSLADFAIPPACRDGQVSGQRLGARHAHLTTRSLRYPVRCRLSERGRLEPAAARHAGGGARGRRAQGPALEARADFSEQAA